MALSSDERKQRPMARGCLDYFPDALMEVAHVSFVGNEQHNPGEPMHWAKEKSTDEADCILRHLVARGTRDEDGLRHTAKVAWRALALLQRELDAEQHKEEDDYEAVFAWADATLLRELGAKLGIGSGPDDAQGDAQSGVRSDVPPGDDTCSCSNCRQ